MRTEATTSNDRIASTRGARPSDGLVDAPPERAFPLTTAARPCQTRARTAPPPPLEALVPSLIEAMRQELLHWGEMLAFLSEWKSRLEALTEHSLDEIEIAIDRQSQAIQAARARRAKWQRRVRQELNAPGDLSFSQVIVLLPTEYQAVVASLEHENGRLAARIQARLQRQLRQDHLAGIRS